MIYSATLFSTISSIARLIASRSSSDSPWLANRMAIWSAAARLASRRFSGKSSHAAMALDDARRGELENAG